MSIRIGQWFQGPTDSGQGGWTAHRLQTAIGQPVSVAIRRPIPLETDLEVVEVVDAWHLIDPADPEQPVLIATAASANFASTDAVSLADAQQARTRFPLHEDHPVPVCFSCGAQPDSMQVHSGDLPDGRWATDWRVPDWAVDDAGEVDEGALWAAIDCAQAWYAGNADGRKHCVTVQLEVALNEPLEPGATYVLVAWEGTYPREWDGRKRGAGAAAFTIDGRCVAHSSSFWIAPNAF